MIPLALTVVLVFLCIYVSELLWRHRNIDAEYTRKFVHISVGSFVAFWPFFLSRAEIVGLGAAFLLVVGSAHYLNLFQAIRSVQRPTWGEALFAVAVGALAFVARDNWVYAAALLHMSLADGLAAIVGTKFGRRSRYHILGYSKSVVGTLTFLVASLAILTVYALLASGHFNPWYLAVALVAGALENLGVRGLDNLFVPIAVAVGLNLLH